MKIDLNAVFIILNNDETLLSVVSMQFTFDTKSIGTRKV